MSVRVSTYLSFRFLTAVERLPTLPEDLTFGARVADMLLAHDVWLLHVLKSNGDWLVKDVLDVVDTATWCQRYAYEVHAYELH